MMDMRGYGEFFSSRAEHVAAAMPAICAEAFLVTKAPVEGAPRKEPVDVPLTMDPKGAINAFLNSQKFRNFSFTDDNLVDYGELMGDNDM